jgi:hypothetical protein
MWTILVIILVLALGGAGFVALSRGSGTSKWKALLEEAAKRLGGRASPPELRALVDGLTINTKIAAGERAVASTKLEEGTERLRIFVGWDVPAIPEGLAHFPEITLPVAYTFAGAMTTRANEREIADRFLERAARELIELRASTHASTLAVTVRGGHLEIALTGIERTAEAIETLTRTTAALAKRLRFEERSAPALPAERRCVACMDTGGDEAEWTACGKCGAWYHRACYAKGGGCIVPGCA